MKFTRKHLIIVISRIHVVFDQSNLIMFGAISGIIASLVFIVFHYVTISPIWFAIPLGFVFGSLTGATLAWSYTLLFDRVSIINSIKLTSLYFIPIVLLELITYFTLKREYSIEEASDPNAVGPLLAVSFGIVIPFSLVYGLIQGFLLGASKEIILSSVATNFMIFVGIGHNLPIFNKVVIDDNWLLIRAKLLILAIFMVLIATWIISLHLLIRIED